MPEVKTIAWDIDDVLNDLTKAWFANAWLPSHSDCRLTYRELTANPPHVLLGVSREKYLASLDRFRLSSEAASMDPDKTVMNWFREYGQRFRHIAVTARPRETAGCAVQWLLRHFGEWFQTFAFIPSPRPGQPSSQPDRNKGDFLAWLSRVDFFVDDNPGHCQAARDLGIRSFLVAQPWNRGALTINEILERIVDGGEEP